MTRARTLRDVLEDPGVVGRGGPIPIEEYRACLQDRGHIRHDLVPVQILAGIGAWFATGFFVAFFGMANLFDNEVLTLLIGLMLLIGGTFLGRLRSPNVFVQQISLALALTGNGLLWAGVAHAVHGDALQELVLTQLLVCLVFYPISGSFAFRFLAPIAVSLLTVIWAFDQSVFWFLHVLLAIEILLFGGLWLGRPRKRALLPLAYASACMLPASILWIELARMDLFWVERSASLWPTTLLLTLGLLWVYARLAGNRMAMRSPDFLLAVLGTIALGAVSTPGVLVALGLLVVGRGLGNRYLLTLGYLFLPVFLITYYYSLRVDLASKSWVLIASGLALIGIQLALRWITRREGDQGARGETGV